LRASDSYRGASRIESPLICYSRLGLYLYLYGA